MIAFYAGGVSGLLEAVMFTRGRRLTSFAAVFLVLGIVSLGIGSFPWALDQFNQVH